MKNITKLREKFLILMCIITTIYCLFFYELIESSCLPTIMYTLAGLWIFLIFISVFELIGFLFSKKRAEKKLYYKSDGFIAAHINVLLPLTNGNLCECNSFSRTNCKEHCLVSRKALLSSSKKRTEF